MTALPHPTQVPFGDTPPNGFVRIEQRVCTEEYWHFSLYVPASMMRGPEGEAGPSAMDESATLGMFQLAEPATDIEVIGTWLPYEVDPADWLDAEIEALGYEVVSRRPVKLLDGVAGDVVARWEHEGRSFAGRFIAAKYGARLYTVCCRCALDDYATLADQLFVAAASLRPLNAWPGRFAETVSFVTEDMPFDWKLAVPTSWEIVQHAGSDDGAWFEASHIAPSAPDEQLGEHDGRLALAVMTRSSAKRPRDAANVYLQALLENDIAIEATNFEIDDATEPFGQAWYLTSPIERQGVRGELRCRVMLHEHAWVVGGVIGPDRADDQGAWMRNKRALDIATATLEVDTSL